MNIPNWKINLIDWEETKNTYNYVDQNELVSKSKVIVICKDCKKPNLYTTISSMRVRADQKRRGQTEYYPICKACQQTRTWKSNEFRENQSEVQSKAMKKVWKNKEYRNNISSKISKNSIQQWQDQEYRNKIVNGVKNAHNTIEGYTKSTIIAMRSPEAIQKAKTSARIIYDSKEYKQKMSKIAKDKWANDEYRSKMLPISISLINKIACTKISKLEETFAAFLNSANIIHKRQFMLGPWSFDFMIPHSPNNILVEIQGEYWHGKLHNYDSPRDKAKATFIELYHSDKYSLKTIWEHEFLVPTLIIDRIATWFGIKPSLLDIKLSDCNVIYDIPANDANVFLSRYHYTANGGRNGMKFGVYHNNNLIAVAKFCSPTRAESATRLKLKQSELLELTRLAIHPQYQIKNLASWFLGRCVKSIKKLRPNIVTLLTFADETFGHVGTIYKASGWVHDGVIESDYVYLKDDGYIMHKRTLWGQSKKMGVSENEYAILHGYSKIWGKQKHRYIKKL